MTTPKRSELLGQLHDQWNKEDERKGCGCHVTSMTDQQLQAIARDVLRQRLETMHRETRQQLGHLFVSLNYKEDYDPNGIVAYRQSIIDTLFPEPAGAGSEASSD